MKKIVYTIFAVMLLSTGAVVGRSNTANEDLNDLQLSNAEALSSAESGGYLVVTPVKYDWGWGCNCAGQGDKPCC